MLKMLSLNLFPNRKKTEKELVPVRNKILSLELLLKAGVCGENSSLLEELVLFVGN